jgi:hypothetical protein
MYSLLDGGHRYDDPESVLFDHHAVIAFVFDYRMDAILNHDRMRLVVGCLMWMGTVEVERDLKRTA